MRTIRVHHSVPLANNMQFALTPDATRHLVKVLRMRVGDAFTVFDGSGREWSATLLDSRGAARAGVGSEVSRESPVAVTLVQGISKGDRMDVAVQKAVELGATAIQPVFAERSIVSLDAARSAKRVAHWQGIVIAACEQCGRNVVPRVLEPVTLTAWLATRSLPALVLDPAASLPLPALPGGMPPAVALLVGPEGGFSDAELIAARDAGCTGVSLGPRVLRTETAGTAALAAIQALYGDYR